MRFQIFSPLVLFLLVATVGAQDIIDGQADRLNGGDTTLLNDVQEGMGRTVNPGGKWMGVLCGPVDDVVRAHIRMEEGTGLVIQEVVPDSPAEEAGLKKHDILLRVDGEPLRSVAMLVDKVNSAGDKGLKITWLRSGDEMTATVLPGDRPESANVFVPATPDVPRSQELGRFREWIEKLEKGGGENDEPLEFRFFGPGIKMNQLGKFPQGLKVQINKSGDEPAQIKVEKDGETWELTEDQIETLPEEIRPFVESMLSGQGALQLKQFRVPGMQTPWPKFEQRIDEMNERMDKMFDELKRLREQDADEKDEETIDA